MGWAALIKRICEVDPLKCPECGGTMAIISFIEKRDQADVIQKILKYCSLWPACADTAGRERPATRAPPENDQPADGYSTLEKAGRDPDRPSDSKGCRVLKEREYVDEDEFLMAL